MIVVLLLILYRKVPLCCKMRVCRESRDMVRPQRKVSLLHLHTSALRYVSLSITKMFLLKRHNETTADLGNDCDSLVLGQWEVLKFIMIFCLSLSMRYERKSSKSASLLPMRDNLDFNKMSFVTFLSDGTRNEVLRCLPSNVGQLSYQKYRLVKVLQLKTT